MAFAQFDDRWNRSRQGRERPGVWTYSNGRASVHNDRHPNNVGYCCVRLLQCWHVAMLAFAACACGGCSREAACLSGCVTRTCYRNWFGFLLGVVTLFWCTLTAASYFELALKVRSFPSLRLRRLELSVLLIVCDPVDGMFISTDGAPEVAGCVPCFSVLRIVRPIDAILSHRAAVRSFDAIHKGAGVKVLYI